jgi:hypothetical protein
MEDGYSLAENTIILTTHTCQDVVLQSDEPKVSIYQWRDENDDIQMQIESNRTLITNPTIELSQGGAPYDISQYVEVGLDNTYKISIQKSSTNIAGVLDTNDIELNFNTAEDITINVSVLDVTQKSGSGIAVMNLEKKTQVRFILTDLIVGGDVEFDKSGTDQTKVTFYPGSFEVGLGTVTSVITVDKTDPADDGHIDVEESSYTASGVYTLQLIEAALKEGNPITLTFDYDETKDTGTITVCFYDEKKDQWIPIEVTITKDPVTGTLSVDFTTTDVTTSSGESMLAFVPYVKGVGYDVKNAVKPIKAQSLLSGMKFAVFTQAPAYITDDQGQEESNSAYSGDEFRMYNFPNPFDLNTKNVTLANTGTNSALQGLISIKGTVLKYYLPAKYDTGAGANIKFYVFNVAGELVRVIDDEPVRDGGYIYFTEWDGKNDSGQDCASGVYLLIPYVNDDVAMDEAVKMAIIK